MSNGRHLVTSNDFSFDSVDLLLIPNVVECQPVLSVEINSRYFK